MRNRNTLEFIGLWEVLNNENFNRVQFDTFRNEAGLNRFTMTPQKWIDSTNAIGIISYGGQEQMFTLTPESLLSRKKGRKHADAEEIFKRIFKGSMPAIVSGDISSPGIFYNSYLSTYIERDVKSLSDAIDSLKFLRFITALAARCSQMLNISELARDAELNQKQVKDWLGILETLGILFYLYPYSNNLLKRLVKTPKVYFYDTGLVAYLTKWSGTENFIL